MSNKNVLQNFLLVILLAICSALLCFIGVFAINESIKIKLIATFSPDVFCSVEYSTDKITWTKIFDNDNYATYIDNDYIESTSLNTINIKTTVSGQVTSSLYFRVTNYTPSKHIKALIQDYKINDVASDLYYANSVVCAKYTLTPTINDDLVLIMTGNAGMSLIQVTLKIQEAFLVDYSNTENLANENEYVTNDGDAVLNLEPIVGSYLPDSVEVKVDNVSLVSGQYSYNKSAKTITIYAVNITGDIEIYCVATKVYAVYQYAEANTISNGYTGGSEFNYKYYIEMGRYPQTYVGATLNTTLETAYNGGSMINGMTMAQENGADISYSQTLFTGSTLASSQIIWANYNNKTYARSLSFAVASGITYTTGDALPKSAGQYRWYEVQPVYWTVIGTTDNNLSSLYYRDNMLYTDSLMGKEYSGGLLVMSELAVDTSRFSTTNSTFDSGQLLYDFLNSSSGAFAKYSGLAKYFATSASPTSNYIRSNALTTYGYYDGVMQNKTGLNSNLFMLSGLYNDGIINNTSYTQSYNFATYFNNGYNSASIGITSPTDYALGHATYSTSTSSYTRAWSSNIPTTTYTSVYWLRSGQTSTKASLINLTGSINIDTATTFVYTVRPCLIINLNV